MTYYVTFKFVHLHCHTRFSFLDGHCDIKAMVEKAKSLGQTALAITDHGYMYGAIEFYNSCMAAGIKPIIGCELYTAKNAFEKFKGESRGHITLLAKDEAGYRNLLHLASFAATDGFYYRPRVDTQMLREYHEGIICLSGCIQGDLQRAILANDAELATRIATEYRDIFGEDYYIELQYHGIPEQKKVLAGQIKLARELGIPMVATNDVHYIERSAAEAQRVMMCIGMQTTVDDQNATGYGTPHEMYIKNEEEMALIFSKIAPEALANTAAIADKCNLTIEQGHYLLPAYETPNGKDNLSYFTTLCRAGLIKRYGDRAGEYRGRLEYEVSTIKNMGFVDYFLIVFDIVAYARRQGITIGCRGSAGGSIVAYCLGISEIDPMRWNLAFERFLNPERVNMPDIDLDVDPEGREALVNYLTEKYGEDHVCQITTSDTEGAKFAIRDTGKALGMTQEFINRVSGFIPKSSQLSISESMAADAAFRKAYETEPEVRKLIDLAKQIEGTKRNPGIHAAAVIVSPDALANHVPLKRNTETNRLVSQYDMAAAEAVGMLKLDLLGLRNLTVIHTAEEAIRQTNPEFSIAAIPLDDAAVYEMFSRGDTFGVFQFESEGMRDVLKRMQPSRFEDLIAAIALYRPGPMEQIPKFIEGKRAPDKIEYLHPIVRPILEDTYGIPLYQEQVMAIVRDCAGYSMGRSDLVRRAMSKKKAKVLEEEREYFLHGKPETQQQAAIPGCEANGIALETAEALWAMMAKFAEYGFNKSHAASYARVAFQTAYLKTHYPLEYRSALLTSEIGKDGNRRLIRLIHDSESHGISVLPPDINRSETGFSVEDGCIRFGLAAIKDTGKAILAEILMERSLNGPYADLKDLVERCMNTCDKSTLAALVKSGALDSFPQTRDQMLAVIDGVLKKVRAARKKLAQERMQYEDSFFCDEADDEKPFHLAEIEYPEPAKLAANALFDMEMESTGMYITGHPIHAYADRIKGRTTHDILDLDEELGADLAPETPVRIAGIVVDVSKRTTRQKKQMAQMVIEDHSGKIGVTVFPRAFESYGARLVHGAAILVFGKLDTDSFGRKVVADSIAFLDNTSAEGDS